VEKCHLSKSDKKLTRADIYQLKTLILPAFVVILTSISFTALIWLGLSQDQTSQFINSHDSKERSLFAINYPANGPFQAELTDLKSQNILKKADEIEIQRSILAATDYLDIPPSLLWCLLFQESRLNHLDGIESDKASSGLGQFSRFSFFEINHQLERYSPNVSNLIFLTFGRDIRPIAAKRGDLVSLSSYYSIPTAVTASAIYLHNRYFQLSQLLEKKGISYRSDILWLFAMMAYNKGSRSVLSFWNTIYRKNGPEYFSELLNNYDFFRSNTEDTVLLTKSLNKIWEEAKAKPYARELRIHTKNITSCAVSPMFQTTRSLTEVTP